MSSPSEASLTAVILFGASQRVKVEAVTSHRDGGPSWRVTHPNAKLTRVGSISACTTRAQLHFYSLAGLAFLLRDSQTLRPPFTSCRFITSERIIFIESTEVQSKRVLYSGRARSAPTYVSSGLGRQVESQQERQHSPQTKTQVIVS